MIGIYLCDDEEAVRHQIRAALEWKILVENYDMKVVCSAANAQELLDTTQNARRGIYFLDVELKDEEWDGFRLGCELRRRDPHGILVYITSYGDLAWRTFQYHLEAFDYIVKGPEPIGPSASQCLEEIHVRLLAERQAPTETFTLRTGEMVRHVPMSDILFLKPPPLHTMSFFTPPTAGLIFRQSKRIGKSAGGAIYPHTPGLSGSGGQD